jgi:hypothetical protein
MPPEILDKKFTQRGWQLDPHVCPTCARNAEYAPPEGEPLQGVLREVEPAPEPEPKMVMCAPTPTPTPTPEVDPLIALITAPKPVPTTTKEIEPPMATVTTIPIPSIPEDRNAAALAAASNKAHKATAVMHRLLTCYFDAEAGRYDTGWNDAKIAEESGMALDYVTNTRKLAYGEVKETAEIAELRAEIRKLELTIAELNAGAQKEVHALSVRISEVAARMGVQ